MEPGREVGGGRWMRGISTWLVPDAMRPASWRSEFFLRAVLGESPEGGARKS